jgi:predicted ATPase
MSASPTRANMLRLVVFLDDLHWIDSATVDLLRYVLHRLAELPVWLVGAYQQEGLDAEHPFLRLRSALLVEDRASVLRLVRLPAGAIVDWISSLPGMELDSPERARLTNVIVQRGQGNPFITSQILRDLREVAASSQTGSTQSAQDEAQPLMSSSPSMRDESESVRDATQWPLQAARVPFAVREIVLLKLNRLTPAARSLLCEAAAIGEQFDAQALAPTEPDQPVADLLAECLENGLITPSQPGVFKFVHPMMREIAAEWLTPWRRQRVGSRSMRDGSQPAQHGGRLAPRSGFATDTASEGNSHADPYALVLSANRYVAHTA